MVVTPQRFENVIAITSPRVQVARNITLAVWYCKFGTLPGAIRSTRLAMAHYEATGAIRGPKTGPFARAVLGDEDAVVLDTWMAKVFEVPHKAFDKKSVRATCADTIRQAAKVLGWTPAQTQAAVWTAAIRAAGKQVPQCMIIDLIG